MLDTILFGHYFYTLSADPDSPGLHPAVLSNFLDGFLGLRDGFGKIFHGQPGSFTSNVQASVNPFKLMSTTNGSLLNG